MSARRPLEGRTVVVTRAAGQARALSRLLENAGARVLEVPTIAIEPPPSWEPLDRALEELAAFDWVVFTSVNAVRQVQARLRARGLDWEALRTRRVAAIGPATAAALAEHGVAVAVTPGEYVAEDLLHHLAAVVRPGERVLLPRAAGARDVLSAGLRGLGAEVVEVTAYVTRPATERSGRLREALAGGDVDVVTLTSSSTARSLAEAFGPEERRRWLAAVTVAAIGPITAATAARYGLRVEIVPREYTIPALAAAIVQHFEGRAAEGRVRT
ncbi:MAG TPA: uroporphyrinogen-III synthase [Calidithermus sp.]|nr:uroporphyrinogen-III synthase [Calidithermus sp.]